MSPTQPVPQHPQQTLLWDYNRKATLYWWTVVPLGALALTFSLIDLVGLPRRDIWLTALGSILAALCAKFSIRQKDVSISFSFNDFFVFLVLFLLGPAAAIVVVTTDAIVITHTATRRLSSRIASPAMAALSMFAAGHLLQGAIYALKALAIWNVGSAVIVFMVFAAGLFLGNTALMMGIPLLKRNEHLTWSLLLGQGGPGAVVAVVSAGFAALLGYTFQDRPATVMLSAVPLLAAIMAVIHVYVRQQTAYHAAREEVAEGLRREAEAAARHIEELRASEQRFQAAFTNAAIGMVLLTRDGRIQQANAALCTLLGQDERSLREHEMAAYVLEPDRELWQRHLRRAQRGDFETFTLEMRFRHDNGRTVWVAAHCSAFTDPVAGAPGLILQAQDITARRDAEMALNHLAYHDSLTGLANRRRLGQLLAQAVNEARNDPANGFALMFLDLDEFKAVNDNLGHEVGDEVLVQLGKRLQASVRPGDVVARLGGDEFAILFYMNMPEDEAGAMLLADRVQQSVSAPCWINGRELRTTASIGIATSAAHYQSAADVLRDADTAMYEAKAAGKVRHAFFRP